MNGAGAGGRLVAARGRQRAQGRTTQLGNRNQRYRDILSYMRQHRMPEPLCYSLKASSGTGFSTDCFLYLEEHFPQDLQRIYAAFPFSRRILYEYHNKQGICQTSTNTFSKAAARK